MRRTRCLFSASSVLARVFMTRAAGHVAPASQLQRLLVPAVYTTQPAAAASRLFSGTARVLRGAYRPKNNKAKLAKSRFPRDREIVHKLILVRGEDGRLSEPQQTSDVLARLDLRVNSLIMIALPETAGERDSKDKGSKEAAEGAEEEADGATSTRSGRPDYPICRIIDRKAEQAAAAEKATVERKKSVASKELEVNWAIAPNDLQTKLRQLKNFLSKGMRVQILLLSKARQKKRSASKDEANEVLRAVKEAVDEVPGSKEFKAMEGAVGGQAKMFIEGPQGGAS